MIETYPRPQPELPRDPFESPIIDSIVRALGKDDPAGDYERLGWSRLSNEAIRKQSEDQGTELPEGINSTPDLEARGWLRTIARHLEPKPVKK